MAEEKRKEKKEKKSSAEKKDKKGSSNAHEQNAVASQPTLLADENAIDSKLSSLFAVKPALKKPAPQLTAPAPATEEPAEDEEMNDVGETLEDEAEIAAPSGTKSKKRKRRDEADDLEDNYLRKVARQSEQEVEQLKRENTAVLPIGQSVSDDEAEEAQEDVDAASVGSDDEDDEHYVPPQHETQTGASPELEKANRTVFIGNVAAEAVTSKSARKELEKHLKSFFNDIPKVTEEEKKAFKLEALRFRSTPFDPKLPKKAAFARGEIMTTTVQSSNAYAVYSTQALAREACRRLNATVVLDRHIRVDSVAHPAPVAHKRCVFVGNLGFVNDETNIKAAEENGKKQKERKPADIEEGLWRLFGKHGTVESVRVVRDSKTRVGIGIAYVQFTDDIAVESALSEDGKAAPPMLPRKLRVTRARAMKRSKPTDKTRAPEKAEGYKRKVTHGESTLNGRLGKLMGKAAASKARKDPKTGALVKRPEDFVFEGHRASAKEKNTGMKFNKKAKKAKPTGRAAKRTAAFKSGSLKKSRRG